MKVTGVRSANLDDVWPQVKPMIEKAQSYARWHTNSLERIFRDLQSAKRQLWITYKKAGDIQQAMVTSIEKRDSLVCRIDCIAGGSEEDAMHLFPVIESWAMVQGCTTIEATTRPGGARKLHRKGGYACVGCIMQKEIYHE